MVDLACALADDPDRALGLLSVASHDAHLTLMGGSNDTAQLARLQTLAGNSVGKTGSPGRDPG